MLLRLAARERPIVGVLSLALPALVYAANFSIPIVPASDNDPHPQPPSYESYPKFVVNLQWIMRDRVLQAQDPRILPSSTIRLAQGSSNAHKTRVQVLGEWCEMNSSPSSPPKAEKKNSIQRGLSVLVQLWYDSYRYVDDGSVVAAKQRLMDDLEADEKGKHCVVGSGVIFRLRDVRELPAIYDKFAREDGGAADAGRWWCNVPLLGRWCCRRRCRDPQNPMRTLFEDLYNKVTENNMYWWLDFTRSFYVWAGGYEYPSAVGVFHADWDQEVFGMETYAKQDDFLRFFADKDWGWTNSLQEAATHGRWVWGHENSWFGANFGTSPTPTSALAASVEEADTRTAAGDVLSAPLRKERLSLWAESALLVPGNLYDAEANYKRYQKIAFEVSGLQALAEEHGVQWPSLGDVRLKGCKTRTGGTKKHDINFRSEQSASCRGPDSKQQVSY